MPSENGGYLNKKWWVYLAFKKSDGDFSKTDFKWEHWSNPALPYKDPYPELPTPPKASS